MTTALVSKHFIASFSDQMTALAQGAGKSVTFGHWVRGEPMVNVQRPS